MRTALSSYIILVLNQSLLSTFSAIVSELPNAFYSVSMDFAVVVIIFFIMLINFTHYPAGIPNSDDICGNIGCHNASCADDGMISN